MSDSALATIKIYSPNYVERKHKIDTITIHHTAAVGVTARQIGDSFSSAARRASSNYGVGNDGSIGVYVPEYRRAITSSNSANDDRAVTIEVANCAGWPDWPISAAAWDALIDLVTDICKRNDIPELRWRGDPSLIGQPELQNMTVHRWFAATACPGEYLYTRMGEIAAAVNARLGVKEEEDMAEKRYNTIDSIPEWAQLTVKKLCRLGLIEGHGGPTDAQGYPTTLDLSLDMIRMMIINDRAGCYDNVAVVK